jgi:Na+/phosphate symporter
MPPCQGLCDNIYRMQTQNYANHRRTVPMFHGVLFFLIVLTLIGSFVNVWQSWGNHERIYSASLIVVLTVALLMLFFFCRIFALKAQDRAIRAEENLRHFVLTGKLLDPKLSVLQTVALRFASDAEFVELAQRAADEGLAPDAIKRSVKQWRADYYRV